MQAAEAAAARLEAGRRPRFFTWRKAGLSFMAALALWGIVRTGWIVFGCGAVKSEPADDRTSVAVLPLEKWYVTTEMQDHFIDRLRKASLEIPDARLTGRSP
jgi:hypothetical protein